MEIGKLREIPTKYRRRLINRRSVLLDKERRLVLEVMVVVVVVGRGRKGTRPD